MALSLYHQLLDAPDLKLLIDRVQQQLAAEQQKRQEFYDWLTPEVKAEFINGEIVMHSPAKGRHLFANQRLFTLLELYTSTQELGVVHTEKALVALTRNDYEPDICYWKLEKAKDFDGDTMRHPAPDLVVEVLSLSTEARDRGVKFTDYAAHGVQEYWIVDPLAQTVETYELDQDLKRYEPVEPLTIKATLRSGVVAGFAIPVRAIFDAEAYAAALRGIMGEAN